MNKKEFWESLNKNEKEMVKEVYSDNKEYGNDYAAVIFDFFKKGANKNDFSVEEYLEKVSPNEYVRAIFESASFYGDKVYANTYERLMKK